MQARPPPVSQVSQKCGRCFSSVAQCQCPAACRRIRTSPRSVFSICNSTGILNVSVMSNLRDDKNGQKFKKKLQGTTGRTFKIPFFFPCYDKSWHSAYSLGNKCSKFVRWRDDATALSAVERWTRERRVALWLGRTLEDLNPFWHFGLPTAHWADPRLFWPLVNLADGIHIGPDEKEQKIKENAVLLEL